MEKKGYRDDCNGCKISKGKERKIGGVISLPGEWSLNHYSGPEGFLGWLALAPRYHRMGLIDLYPNEAATLGRNIQNIDKALQKYWRLNFKIDRLKRVYVVYFFESTDYHLHIHLIPRPESFSYAFSTRKPAWDTPKLTTCWSEFPERYRIRCREKAIMWNSEIEKKEEVIKIMAFIKDFLKATWVISPEQETKNGIPKVMKGR